MTDKEKAIVMAYTGIAMLTGDKFDIFHKYVEDIMGRPVFTHEFAICAEEIKEKAKPDFLKLCAEEEKRPHGEWIECEVRNIFGETMKAYECSICKRKNIGDVWIMMELPFCPNCGSDNRRKEGESN